MTRVQLIAEAAKKAAAETARINEALKRKDETLARELFKSSMGREGYRAQA
jgi:hypothetical protein